MKCVIPLKEACCCLLVVSAFAACGGGGKTGTQDSGKPAKDSAAKKDGDAHQAPHGGLLVELGRDHKYHGELVVDSSANSVSVYILGEDLKPISIEAESVDVVFGNDSWKLSAVDLENGAASLFQLVDQSLTTAASAKILHGKLRTTIEGKPISGEIHVH